MEGRGERLWLDWRNLSSKIDCSIRKAEMEERGDDVGGREGRETRQLDWDTSIIPLSLLLVLQAAASVPPHQNLVCLHSSNLSYQRDYSPHIHRRRQQTLWDTMGYGDGEEGRD